MPRGGKRTGAGRKGEGMVSKTVSLSLPAELWAEIEKSGRSPSAFVREMKDTKNDEELDRLRKELSAAQDAIKKLQTEKNTVKPVSASSFEVYNDCTKRDALMHFKLYSKGVPDDIIEKAKESLSVLYPNGSEVAKAISKSKYQCPYTGKWFGSINAMVHAVIPVLIRWAEGDVRRDTEREERKRIESEGIHQKHKGSLLR